MLKVNFVGKNLQDIYQNPTKWSGKYPPGIIKKYIKLVTLMQLDSINDVREINNFGKYNIEPKQGNMKGLRAGRLNESRRLEFEIFESSIQIINLKKISNHYE